MSDKTLSCLLSLCETNKTVRFGIPKCKAPLLCTAIFFPLSTVHRGSITSPQICPTKPPPHFS